MFLIGPNSLTDILDDQVAGDRVAIYWAILWRAVVAFIFAVVIADVVGNAATMAIAFFRGMFGLPETSVLTNKVIGYIAVAIAMMSSYWFWLHWLLKSKLGKVRIVVVRALDSDPA
jgi:hypothetical protein